MFRSNFIRILIKNAIICCKTQIDDIVEKNVIYFEGALGRDKGGDRDSNNNNSFNHLFKDNKSIEMGFSIVDIRKKPRLVKINK